MEMEIDGKFVSRCEVGLVIGHRIIHSFILSFVQNKWRWILGDCNSRVCFFF